MTRILSGGSQEEGERKNVRGKSRESERGSETMLGAGGARAEPRAGRGGAGRWAVGTGVGAGCECTVRGPRASVCSGEKGAMGGPGTAVLTCLCLEA